jgi:hypothetical protein
VRFFTAIPGSFPIPYFNGRMFVRIESFSERPAGEQVTEDDEPLARNVDYKRMDWGEIAMRHANTCKTMPKGTVVTYHLSHEAEIQ